MSLLLHPGFPITPCNAEGAFALRPLARLRLPPFQTICASRLQHFQHCSTHQTRTITNPMSHRRADARLVPSTTIAWRSARSSFSTPDDVLKLGHAKGIMKPTCTCFYKWIGRVAIPTAHLELQRIELLHNIPQATWHPSSPLHKASCQRFARTHVPEQADPIRFLLTLYCPSLPYKAIRAVGCCHSLRREKPCTNLATMTLNSCKLQYM